MIMDFPEHHFSAATSHTHFTNFKQIAEMKIDRSKHELNNVTKDSHNLMQNHEWAFFQHCQNE